MWTQGDASGCGTGRRAVQLLVSSGTEEVRCNGRVLLSNPLQGSARRFLLRHKFCRWLSVRHGHPFLFLRAHLGIECEKSKKEKAVLRWKAWILEDLSAHPYRWLPPDLVPPSLFLQCDPRDTVGGSGVIADPALIDANFREVWMP